MIPRKAKILVLSVERSHPLMVVLLLGVLIERVATNAIGAP